jgi:hypothetical protein
MESWRRFRMTPIQDIDLNLSDEDHPMTRICIKTLPHHEFCTQRHPPNNKMSALRLFGGATTRAFTRLPIRTFPTVPTAQPLRLSSRSFKSLQTRPKANLEQRVQRLRRIPTPFRRTIHEGQPAQKPQEKARSWPDLIFQGTSFYLGFGAGILIWSVIPEDCEDESEDCEDEPEDCEDELEIGDGNVNEKKSGRSE